MENNVAKVRKGAWSPEEDALLQRCVLQYGEGQWHLAPERAGLRRCRKSCRLRWLNYLKPSIKRGEFQEDEVDLIIRLHKLLGNRWSLIAGRIPGRTANDIKNCWNSCWSKKVGAQAKVARKINKRNTVGLAVEKYKSCILGQARQTPHLARFTEAIGGCRHEIFRPRPRTLSEGQTCLPDIITCSEFLPGRQCFSSTDERSYNEQDLVAWRWLLLEDDEKDREQRQQEEREKRDVIPFQSKKTCSIGRLRQMKRWNKDGGRRGGRIFCWMPT
ncbi:unnamed protein product [Spirodela intermedia]|uniref:Uncharacterized protein n=1 Tax=Spirodela intermedia TaxID=51605 RepID=A0A7I8J615_SPIIN|nr:unnamed protein product [Spirodela intermedia]CAA6664882.1 unnamed protein product [Spirodela intermedia]